MKLSQRKARSRFDSSLKNDVKPGQMSRHSLQVKAPRGLVTCRAACSRLSVYQYHEMSGAMLSERSGHALV